MDVRGALKSQYHAGLATVRQAIEHCSEEIWTDASGRLNMKPL